jgi:primosomal protein N' (replication factor Y)
MAARSGLKFPPFTDLAVLTFSHRDDERASVVAHEAADSIASGLIAEHIDGVRVLGPSPAFIHKLRNEYRWQLTLKGERLERARHLAPRGKGWVYDVDPVS